MSVIRHTYPGIKDPDCPLQITGYAVLVHLAGDKEPYSAFGKFDADGEAFAIIEWLNDSEKDYHIWPLVFLKPTAVPLEKNDGN